MGIDGIVAWGDGVSMNPLVMGSFLSVYEKWVGGDHRAPRCHTCGTPGGRPLPIL